MKQEKGSVGEYLAVCLSLILMTMIMVGFLNSIQLISAKSKVNQISRKYLLRMETVGGLSESDKVLLMHDLEDIGATEITLEGTTFGPVGYGEEIVIHIRGKIQDEYEFEERKVSTAKH